MTLRLTAAVRDAIVAHARDEYPKEACGIIAGQRGIGTRVFRMRNADASPINYTMDPTEQLHVMKQMRAEALEMLAIYHSHTATPAYPSPTDARLATYPDVAYVLISLKDQGRPEVKSFRIVDGSISAEALQVIEHARTPHG